MSRVFIALSFLMGLVVLSSNYLVQFPVKYYGLQDILTYGAFTYPIAFLITDLANRSYGKQIARKIVYFGFVVGISFTLFFSCYMVHHESRRGETVCDPPDHHAETRASSSSSSF